MGVRNKSSKCHSRQKPSSSSTTTTPITNATAHFVVSSAAMPTRHRRPGPMLLTISPSTSTDALSTRCFGAEGLQRLSTAGVQQRHQRRRLDCGYLNPINDCCLMSPAHVTIRRTRTCRTHRIAVLHALLCFAHSGRRTTAKSPWRRRVSAIAQVRCVFLAQELCCV